MRNTRFLPLQLSLGLMLATVAAAHEGHEHRAMGTVASVKEGELEIKAKDGQTVQLVLDVETKYQKGKAKAGAADLKPGDRVAVTYIEKSGKKHAHLIRMSAPQAVPSPGATTPKPAASPAPGSLPKTPSGAGPSAPATPQQAPTPSPSPAPDA